MVPQLQVHLSLSGVTLQKTKRRGALDVPTQTDSPHITALTPDPPPVQVQPSALPPDPVGLTSIFLSPEEGGFVLTTCRSLMTYSHTEIGS